MTENGPVTTVASQATHGETTPSTPSPLHAVAAIADLAASIEVQCKHLDQLAADRDAAQESAKRERAHAVMAADAAVMAARVRANQTHQSISNTLTHADCPTPAHFTTFTPAQGTFAADPAWTKRNERLATEWQALATARGDAGRYRVFTTAVKWTFGIGLVFLLGGIGGAIFSTDGGNAVVGFGYGLPGAALAFIPLIVKSQKKNSLQADADAKKRSLQQSAAGWWDEVCSEVLAAEEAAEAVEATATKKETAARDAAAAVFQTESTRTREAVKADESELRKGITWLDNGLVQGSWSDRAWAGWTPTDTTPSCVRIGRALPKMPHFYAHFPEAPTVEVPALVNYRGGSGLLFESDVALRDARSIAQNIVLRLLATLPAAAVRFVFIDPVSLGDNVASFMALERHEAALIGGKAWSDPAHIDQALLEITEHMETVIQKYLRDDFATIEEYNAQARVKEAYRVVAVFDFPVNFTDGSARRLASIMRNGPRCGVFPIVIADTSKPLPYGFSLSDLEQFATVLRQSDQISAREGAVARFNAHLTSIEGVDVIALTQQLQVVTGLDPENARRLGDGYGLPKLIAENVTPEQAVEIQRRLDSVGAGVGFTFASEASAQQAGVPFGEMFRLLDDDESKSDSGRDGGRP